jgi:hypothetical protein
MGDNEPLWFVIALLSGLVLVLARLFSNRLGWHWR